MRYINVETYFRTHVYSRQDPLELRKRIIMLRKICKPVWWLHLLNCCNSSVQGYLSLKSNKHHYFLIVLMFCYKCRSCFIIRSCSRSYYRYNSRKLQIYIITNILNQGIFHKYLRNCNVAKIHICNL